MKVLLLYEYPPVPTGLSTQGDLLFRGLRQMGAEAHAAARDSAQEKEWYYRWFKPDIVVGVGCWTQTPQLVLHPMRHGAQPVPWLVADGYVADYAEALNDLPLILVTSNWVREVYARDGINPDIMEVLPVGCDTSAFRPRDMTDPKIAAVREGLGVAPDEIMILTVGGDAASKGAQEVMQALSLLDTEVPRWKYICKVWPQPRTESQNLADLQLARRLGIEKNVTYVSDKVSRNFMPYLIGACDIYAAPSRLEGFGMPHVEAGACGKPVIAIRAMAFTDTLVDGETALLAGVAQENRVSEAILDEGAGAGSGRRIVFDPPRIADYRANVKDIADYLLKLMQSPELRGRLGEAGRRRVVELFDYRVVAKRFVEIVSRRLYGVGKKAHLEPHDLRAGGFSDTR
jgi:glycosyltransferase involved in cell wall biosynthesis